MSAAAVPCDEGLPYRRLLVALDDSTSSDLALVAAVTAARRDHAAVKLLTVVPDVASTRSCSGRAGSGASARSPAG